MSFLNASTSFTRFRIVDEVPADLWEQIPARLRQFAFMDIDDLAEERAFGWTNFDDMLDTEWRLSPPEKADYLVFTLRLETRRIPAAVLRKHVRIALREEEKAIKEQGRKFIGRERKKEITEQVKLRLMGRFLPIPAEFQTIWSRRSGEVWFASTQGKMLELFLDLFGRTFELHLEQLLPYALATKILGEKAAAALDAVDPTQFIEE